VDSRFEVQYLSRSYLRWTEKKGGKLPLVRNGKKEKGRVKDMGATECERLEDWKTASAR